MGTTAFELRDNKKITRVKVNMFRFETSKFKNVKGRFDYH